MSRKAGALIAFVCVGVLGFLSFRVVAQAPAPYTFTTITYPASASTIASGIEITGKIVGHYVDSGGATHGFLLSSGNYSSIDYPGAAWSAAFGINNAGLIVGGYGPDAETGRHGFLLNGANFSSIDVPGSSDTIARGINNLGQIVGDYASADGVRHGFLLSGGNYSTVEPPDSGGASARGINDSGQIVGVAGSGPNATGFLLAPGAYSKIEAPESPYTLANGLNNLRDIVGQARGPQPPFQGFRRSGTTFAVVDVPGLPVSWDARGINDLGQIAGSFTDSDGKTYGYRATPSALQTGPVDPNAETRISGVGPVGPVGPAGPAGPAGPPGPPGLPGESAAAVARGAARGAARGRGGAGMRQIAIFDRQGKLLSQVSDPIPAAQISMSIDGGHVAYVLSGGPIIALDLGNKTSTQIVSQGGIPSWSPDGSRMAYMSQATGVQGIYVNSTKGLGGQELILASTTNLFHWSANGNFIIAGAGGNFLALPMVGDKKPTVIMPIAKGNGLRMSPDSRLIAYYSTETGSNQLWVRPFDSTGTSEASATPLKVSTDGALGMVRWRNDGKELYYIAPDGSVMVASITTTPELRAGKPELLFRAPAGFPLTNLVGQQADVSADGQRFVFLVNAGSLPTSTTGR